ncbi:MAG: NAD-dependent epimerase/dehydratase family protein [Devosia sp.]|nr:NAD-dependent epimerase/dehydratase family protein [Devosia sp.]
MNSNDLILVTGASGFVGKWCVVRALEHGYRVRGTIRSAEKAMQVRDTVVALLGEEPASRLELVTADILDDAGWAEAMQGVKAVLHVAAAIRGDEPKDQSVVIRPAVEGTARVMRFAHAAGIGRVVLTSSIATVGYGHGHTTGKRVYDETHFTNLDGIKWKWAYCIGKTQAERAAWEYARANGMELTTIHPGMIFGPALDTDASISLLAVSGLLDGSTPAMPNMGFSVSDVRDVADLHIAALEKPEAAGQRYLATGRYLWFREIADILRPVYPDRNVTQKTVPDWLMRTLAYFGGPIRQIINDIGNEKHFDGSKGEALLGRPFRSAEEATLSAAESVVRLGMLKPKKAR